MSVGPTLLELLLYGLLGAACGGAYFALLHSWTRQYSSGSAARRGIAWAALRLLGAAVFFVALAHRGALALLAGFTGFLLARAIALRATRRSA